MKHLSISPLLAAVLAFQISIGLPLIENSSANLRPATEKQQADISDVRMAVATSFVDPQFEIFENDLSINNTLDLAPTDEFVDQDPFFMRSQSWKSSNLGKVTGSESVAYRISGEDVEIQIPETSKSWTLKKPLHPVFTTGEYIFFSPNQGAKIFGADISAQVANGQGIFFVRRNELASSSVTGQSIPVFFFPLPGADWQATADRDVTVKEIPFENAVAFVDTTGTPLPVSLNDIQTIVKAQSVNLLLATRMAMQKLLSALEQKSSEFNPLRKQLNDAFGTFVQSGRASATKSQVPDLSAEQANIEKIFQDIVNKTVLVSGTKEMLPPKGSTAGFGSLFTGFDLDVPGTQSVFKTAQRSFSEKALSKIYDVLGIPRAEAVDHQLLEFGQRTAVIMAKVSAIYFTGTILRYTLLKKTINERLKTGGLGKPASVTWTILAQSLTLLAQVPYVWPTNAIEFVLDQARVSESARVRKIFNATFGYARRTNTRTPVNYKSLISGVLILGGMDTALVAIQQFYTNEMVLRAVAWQFPWLAGRVHGAFDVANASVILYNLIQVSYNFVAYLTSGAYSYAKDIQEITTNEAIRTVSQRMRDEGLNPDDPKNRKKFDDDVDKVVRTELAKQKLPDEKAFLFDAQSLYQKIQSFFGYQAPEGQAADNYYGITRNGKMGLALDKAIQTARKAGNTEALKVLLSAKKDFSVISRFRQSPGQFLTPSGIIQTAKAFKNVRRQLVTFTITDPAADIAELPSGWTARGTRYTSSEEGPRTAARIFRHQYFQSLGLNGVKEEKADSSKPLDLDPMTAEGRYSRWQLKRALSHANEKFVGLTGKDPADIFSEALTPENESYQDQWKKIFRNELLRQSGLYPDRTEIELIANVEDRTEKDFKQKLEGNPALDAYLKSLPAGDQARVAEIYKSDLFAQNYVVDTIKKEKVTAISPAQPGIYQRARQWDFVRSSTLLTRTARFFEGFHSDSRYERGFKAQTMRALPLVEDLTSGNIRALRFLPVEALFRYFYLHKVWNATLPYQSWAINYSFRGTTIIGPWAFTARIMRNEGWKPGSTNSSMAKYAFIGSWATFSGSLLYVLFHGDIQNGMNAVGHFCTELIKRLAGG